MTIYLGFQVGLDFLPWQQFVRVIVSNRKKLVFWSPLRLSLAGRALEMKVMLSTAWYVVSSWCFLRACTRKLQMLIRNFLWARSNGSRDTRARVSWDSMIRPQQVGDLEILVTVCHR